MGDNQLEILISMINMAVKSLHEKKINVIDKENLDFRLTNVYYDSNKDEVFFETGEI